MNLSGWEYHEIGKETINASVSQLLEIFKREDKKYNEKCTELVANLSVLSEEGKAEFMADCEFLRGCKIITALEIAERLTK